MTEEPCDAATMQMFLTTCANEASDIALALAHEPADKTTEVLSALCGGMRKEMTELLGADATDDLCVMFIRAVWRMKTEIETASLGGRA